MKKTAAALLLFFLFVGAKSADPAAYQVELTVAPLADLPVQLLPHQWRNGFRCEALIVDDATATIIGSIHAVVQPGRREIAEKKIGDLTLRLGVQIAEDRDAAMTEVVLQRGDQILLRQRSTTRFTPRR